MARWISDPQWDPQGRPYVTALADGPGMKKGDVRYISPAEVSPTNTYGADPRLASWAQGNGLPGQTLLQNRGRWNATEGKWDRDVNWSNIASIGVGSMIAAPLIAGALGPGTTAPVVTAPGSSAIAPTATSLAVPTATSTALNTSPYVLGTVGPEVAGGLTAAQMAAGAGAAGLSVGPYVSNLFRPDEPLTAQQQAQQPGQQPGQQSSNTSTNTNSPGLPFGLTGRDLAGYGLNFFNNWMNRNAANDQSEARAAADKAALDFAIRAYDEQKALEQARWDANETRRVPYRRASLDTLAEFRKLLGLGD